LAEDLRNDYFNKGNRSKDRLELSLKYLDSFFGRMRAVDIRSDLIDRY